MAPAVALRFIPYTDDRGDWHLGQLATGGDLQSEARINENVTSSLVSHNIGFDIGYMIAYLCSPAARFVTGQIIAVDGGLSSSHPVIPGKQA